MHVHGVASLLLFLLPGVLPTDFNEERALRELQPLARAGGIETGKPSSTGIPDDAWRDVQSQAEQGSIEAIYILGFFHLYGLQSLEPDEVVAMNMLEQAAKRGHNDAQCAAGILLYHGHGRIKIDGTKAKAYFRSASNGSHSYGHWLLGRSLFQEASSMMASGNSADGELEEAELLFGLAAEEIPEAAHQLAIMYEYGLANNVDEVKGSHFRKAAELYEKASRRGLVESLYHLALIHFDGRGMAKDYLIASELFRRAAMNHKQAHAPSMRYLAIMESNGYLHPANAPDYSAAMRWYEACARTKGFPDVQKLCSLEQKSLSDLINAAQRNES